MAFREVVFEGIEAWNRGDVEGTVAFVHPEIVWETTGYFPGFDDVYHGREGVREFVTEFAAAWEDISIEVLEAAEPLPEQLAIRVKFKAHGRQGIPVDLEICQVYAGRDGLLIRFRAFPEWEDALAAAADPGFGAGAEIGG